MQTLEELKRENAEEEAKAKAEVKELVEAEEETEAEEVETELDESVDADKATDDEGNDQPAWMSEDSDSQDEGNGERKFTGSDIAAAKRKLKLKLESRNSEVDELKQQLEQMKQQLQQPGSNAQQQGFRKPSRDQFDNAEDPDEAYLDALTDWKLATKIQQSQGIAQQQQRQRAVEESQNRHYTAAAKLISEHGISEDIYRQADLNFRRGLDEVKPGAGDLIATELIAQLGEGSEKVAFMLGRNRSKMAQLQQALIEDPNGIKASIMLGQMKAEISMPRKNIRQAPAPTRNIQGDASGSGNNAKRMKKQYESFHKNGDGQAAFNARRAAKKAGVDTSNW